MRTGLLEDLRYGLRILRSSPGFTAVAVLSLALGIGANTAIFSVVNAVLLRPLPYKDPQRLVTIWEVNQKQGLDWSMPSPANLAAWKQQSKLFEDFAAFQWLWTRNLTNIEEPERLQGWQVSANFFSLLGVPPVLGRSFLPEEDLPGGPRVVVISHGLWQRRFGSNPRLIGQVITLDDEGYTVVGIMPSGLLIYPNLKLPEFWAPLAFTGEQLTNHGNRSVMTLARLKPGVSLQQARAELETITRRLEQAYPDTNTGWGADFQPLHQTVVGRVSTALLVLLGAAGFVLLIACANVANLLLARVAVRQKEIAIRRALGASRPRVIRQMLTESVPLVFLGSVCGLLLAFWGVDLLLVMSPGNIPRLDPIGAPLAPDPRVLGFALVISLLTGATFSLAPALQGSKPDLAESLREAAADRPWAAGRGWVHRTPRLRSLLVVSEVALALVLLIGAGLMMNSFLRLRRMDLGFQPENALTMRISVSRSKYSGPAEAGNRRTIRPQARAFFQQVIQRVGALPGVDSAGASVFAVLGGLWERQGFRIEGRPPLARERQPIAECNYVSPHYFRAMGIPLRKGRYFTDGDAAGAPWVVIINETMARRFFPGEDPIGRRLMVGRLEGVWREIVGVVGDVRQYEFEAGPPPQLYSSYLQQRGTYAAWQLDFMLGMALVVHTSGRPARLATAVRSAIREVDKDAAVSDVQTLEEVVFSQVSQRRFYMQLLGIFAGVALVLAAVGIYGVMAYAVGRRTHEIGVRMALGAQASDVLKLVVRQGLALTAIGLAIGWGASFALTRFLTSQLYGVSATDPGTFLVVSLLLAGVALLASYLPARRATKVDPMAALRHE